MFKKTLALLAATAILAVGMGTVAMAEGEATTPECQHTMVEEITVAPTCTSTGTKYIYCSKCGGESQKITLPAKPHAYSTQKDPTLSKAPTCLEEGYDVFVCTTCKTAQDKKPVDKLPHTPAVLPGKMASCTETGLIGGVICTTCHTMLEEQTVVPMLPHQYTDKKVVTKPATCQEKGEEAYVCTMCGEGKKDVTETNFADHDWGKFSTTKAPTCTDKGKEIRYCKVCKAPNTQEIPALDHDWSDFKVTKEETCTEDGKKERTCYTCLMKDEEPIDEWDGHDPQEEVVKEPTCTEKGEKKITCSRCDFSDTKDIEALGHNYSVKLTKREPTCTVSGAIVYYCANGCGQHNTDEDWIERPAAIGHANKVEVQPTQTCETKGHKGGWYCPDCELYAEANQSGKPTDWEWKAALAETMGPDHTYGTTPVITIKGDCKTAARKIFECSACGDRKVVTEEIDPNAHTPKKIDAKDPTCTEDGWKEYTVCTVCNQEIVKKETIPTNGHDLKNLIYNEAVPPKCTEVGYSASAKCPVCKDYVVPASEIPATGHTASDEYIVTKPATCTEKGEKAIKCAVCNQAIPGTEKPTKMAAHQWDKGEVTEPATCTEEGVKTFTCTVCGATKTKAIPVAEHTPEFIEGEEATCTETGLTDGVYCSVCGEPLEPQEVIPMLKHTPEIIPGKAATCTETGLTLGAECTVCGGTIVAQEVIPALGHKYVDGVCETCGQEEPACKHAKTEVIPGKAATCTETGLTDGAKCVKCGEIVKVQEVIPMADHTAKTVAGKAATCTATGLTDGVVCAVCDKELKAQEVIPMADHEMVTVVKAVEPTCTTDGCTEGLACANCDLTVKSESIPRLGHKGYYVAPVAPTCVKDGHGELWACANCQIALTEYDVYMAKGKHTLAYGYNDEYHFEYCVDCGDILRYGSHELVTAVSGGKVHTACKWCAYETVKSIFAK